MGSICETLIERNSVLFEPKREQLIASSKLDEIALDATEYKLGCQRNGISQTKNVAKGSTPILDDRRMLVRIIERLPYGDDPQDDILFSVGRYEGSGEGTFGGFPQRSDEICGHNFSEESCLQDEEGRFLGRELRA